MKYAAIIQSVPDVVTQMVNIGPARGGDGIEQKTTVYYEKNPTRKQ